MAHIQWYPGHIAKAERKLKEKLNLVDVILEVLDARIPLSSIYTDIDKIVGNKQRLIIMNKADLADPESNQKWKDYLTGELGLPVLLNNSSSVKDISSIVKIAVDLGKPEIDKIIAKGRLARPIRAMVIGMPNVGKSSIINKLIKTTKAKVGAKAGVTRTSQWVRVNPKLELLDTPGIIPMKLEDQEKAIKLAFVNSISENAYDSNEIAKDLIKQIFTQYPDRLKSYYKLENILNEPTLENIAEARNWILSGNIPDISRCAFSMLSDFRHGRIGRITLESVPQEQN